MNWQSIWDVDIISRIITYYASVLALNLNFSKVNSSYLILGLSEFIDLLAHYL